MIPPTMKLVVASSTLLALITFSLALEVQNSQKGDESLNKVVTLMETDKITNEFIRGDIDQRDVHEVNSTDSSGPTQLGRAKKEDKMMASAYMGMMMTKAFFNIIFMFINQIFQLKSFGFSLLNAIINIGRFIIQYQQHVNQQTKHEVVKVQTQDWGVGSSGYGYNGQGYQFYQPSGYGAQQTVDDRVTRVSSSSGSQGNSNTLHADNLAYSAYVNSNNGLRT
ncbi:uncharacterized protein LOC142322860 [Lycorma delicatula]|uniref:uncharacterized protein LOC142322860 n=1 Tax=Lycorma delicatula TaxID=130591 RepID=UPI003F50DB21